MISSTQRSIGAKFDFGVEISSCSDDSDEGEDPQSQARAIPECDRDTDVTLSRSTPPKPRSMPLLVPYPDSQNDNHNKPTSSKTVPKDHFKAPLSSEMQKKLTGKTFAESTNHKIGWAVSLYHDWRRARIDSGELNDIFQIINSDVDEPGLDKLNLSTALCAFLSDVKRADGSEYPGKTLYSLLIMIQLHLEKSGLDWKLLDREFLSVQNTLDNLMKNRARSRVGVEKKFDPITVKNEEELWAQGLLGSDNPKQLRETVMYLVGLSFALRGGKEQRSLRCPPYDPQITVQSCADGTKFLEYREDLQSKSNQGGLATRKWQPKIVKALGNSDPSRNIVLVYDKYVSLLPHDLKCNTLYKYELPPGKVTAHTWYQDHPLGINAVSKVVNTLMTRAGIPGHFTNHSFRVTAATRMFNAGVEEQVVKERTGHKSDAVRAYKRTDDSVLEQAEKAAIGEKVQSKVPKRVGKVDKEGLGSVSGSSLYDMFHKVGRKTVKSVRFEVEYHNEQVTD